jgi:hypothetical protein
MPIPKTHNARAWYFDPKKLDDDGLINRNILIGETRTSTQPTADGPLRTGRLKRSNPFFATQQLTRRRKVSADIF